MTTNPFPPVLTGAVRRLMELDQESVFALADIAAERVRQVEAEGWTPAHDDKHASRELATAAAAYALAPPPSRFEQNSAPAFWPWHLAWWKPKSLHRNQVRAGALLVAELARHLRSAR